MPFKPQPPAAVTWCDNGDLFAIWFSANERRTRVLKSSRLKSLVMKMGGSARILPCAHRNLTGSSLPNDGNGTTSTSTMRRRGDWQNPDMSAPQPDNGPDSGAGNHRPEHTRRHQVIAGPSITAEGG